MNPNPWHAPRTTTKGYGTPQALWMAFFSAALYRDVAQRWSGLALKYLWVLLVVAWLPIMIKLHFAFRDFVENDAPPVIRQIPHLSVANGELEVNPPGPHVIRIPGKKTDHVVIIDATGQRGLEDTPEDGVLITKTQLVIKDTKKRQLTAYELKRFGNVSLDQGTIERWLALAKFCFVPLFYLLALLGSFVYRAGQVLLYGGVGLLFARSPKLDYPALVRISAIAITPAVLLDTLRESAGWTVPLWAGICFVLTMGYLFLGVCANHLEPSRRKPEEVLTPGRRGSTVPR